MKNYHKSTLKSTYNNTGLVHQKIKVGCCPQKCSLQGRRWVYRDNRNWISKYKPPNWNSTKRHASAPVPVLRKIFGQQNPVPQYASQISSYPQRDTTQESLTTVFPHKM